MGQSCFTGLLTDNVLLHAAETVYCISGPELAIVRTIVMLRYIVSDVYIDISVRYRSNRIVSVASISIFSLLLSPIFVSPCVLEKHFTCYCIKYAL